VSHETRIDRIEAQLAQLQRSRTLALRNLTFEAWLEEVSPGMTWDWPHLVYVREHLDRVTAGEINRLMIFEPPRHGKSELATIRYSAYRLEQNPAKRVIIGSYNSTLAEKFSRKTRRICERRMTLSDERKAVSDWETAIGGGLRAVGVGGGVTGQGGDLIMIDDPIKSREEANSLAYRDRVWNWYTDDLYTRLEPGGAIVLILTRWHQDDLAGRILSGEDAAQWTVVSLPALAEVNDPLGRAEGEALCPDRYDEDTLAQIKLVQGGSSFASLYQQRPSAAEGAIFKREWWRFFAAPPAFHRIVQSWDTAFKAGADNDYSVCTTWGEADNGYYLLDLWKRRAEFAALKQTAVTIADQFNPSVVLVEDKASGQSLIQELKRDTRLPVMAIKVDSDKVSRAYAVTPAIETGRVFLREGAEWLGGYVDTMADFPNAVHDDEVDSSTQALNYMIGRGSSAGLFEYMRNTSAATKAEALAASAEGTLRLRVPDGMSGVTGYETDAERCVTVPSHLAQQLLEHGYTRVPTQ
jgi:predicted phage terminase large subunit-like protein